MSSIGDLQQAEAVTGSSSEPAARHTEFIARFPAPRIAGADAKTAAQEKQ